ncbi:MAG: hypothetical protein M1824_002168 [Vezdaea acicularis]|nr:MAG: hypothetical protein M1824_002168 [Vezdaea acicularis]
MTSPSSNGEYGFYNFPEPKKGPEVPYSNIRKSNPVVRGFPLSATASFVSSLGFAQNFLWSNAGFNGLRGIKLLDDYEPRYDPTVIPIADSSTKLTTTEPGASTDTPEIASKFHSAAEYHGLYKSGKLTPTSVVETLLPLIRRDISPAGAHSVAFLQTKVDLVRKAAAESTARYKAGTPLGVLDGVPVAIKDEVDLGGYNKTLGSLKDFTRADGATSWCVRKWQEAGAVIVGKLSMHELGLDTTNNNPNYGTPLNPFNSHYYTGGSSGGSGYAVSTGLVPLALGADGGGSIRIPATYCGVYGLKPSHGRVSDSPTHGIAASTGVLGPIAATMADLSLAYRIMATPDPSSSSSSRFPPPQPFPTRNTTRPKVLGICHVWVERADPAVKAAYDAALAHYTSKLGYTTVDISIPFLSEGQTAHAMTILSEISTFTQGDVRGLTAPNKMLISVGARTPATDFLQAQKLRNCLMQHFAHLLVTHPGLIVLTPVTPNAGWHIAGGAADLAVGVSDANMSLRSMEYVWLANFIGCPCLSVPAGYVEPLEGEGPVPVGIMGMAIWGAEDELLEWGRESEEWLEGTERGRLRPGSWVDVVELAKGRPESKNGAVRSNL